MVSPGWGVSRRVGFRFGILFGALSVFPFPIGTIPKTEWLRDLLNTPLQLAVSWFAQDVLGLAAPMMARTGSSDRLWDYVQLLVIAIVAALGTIVWSVVDRRRTAYPRLAYGAQIALRYFVASVMLYYGFGKVLKLQFPDLTPGWLDRHVGEMSPMGLLWTFMGFSRAYTVFAGIAEVIGGVLLLGRRTATLGALIIIAVMTNVVVLNFCYDVPAKLYALQLLVMAVLIAAPNARRLVAAAMGFATPEVEPRPRMSPRWERTERIGKIAVLVAMACNLHVSFSRELAARNVPIHEIYGTWIVDSFVADGVEHPPLTTDRERWQKISANPTLLWISSMTGERDGRQLQIDEEHRRILLASAGQDAAKAPETEVWTYTRPAPDHLVIDGVHLGKDLHVMLHLASDPLLVTRGFHWITDVPFVR
jgi:uncharacterized membrane protein YphA (DoxX/SURF4 family)